MDHWIKILIAYREGKFARYFYGLTPRLIVGASQIPLGGEFENHEIAYNATEQIFEEMKHYNEKGLIVTSNLCDIHKGPVMQFIEAKWTKDSIGTDFGIVWKRYGNEIVSGNFGITPYDLQILNTIFK
ncbi:hypothetical protein SAMN05421636_10813 [Pricia antarctica]|uniref:Uncharacterized protein n=1 Tax=Pricia antarctica TaxID=641691 RepID=A0A1G7G853_9FLAO|nr:hypothetical protein [Pricia antarctica]SDE84300.1 hypothetical protein SAMN05421636_10813 [Pricia antarctica]